MILYLYSCVQAVFKEKGSRYFIIYFNDFQGYNKMLDKLNFKRDKIVDIQKALASADINQDKQLDFDEWRQDLKK